MTTIYEKSTGNMILNSQKAERFCPRIRNETGMPILITCMQHSTRSLARAIRQEKEWKVIQIRKEEENYLCIHDPICRKPQKLQRKKTVRINKC